MSYDIRLKDLKTGKTLHANSKHNFRGGTYALGGNTELWLNVTYNYAKHYYKVIDEEKGIRFLYGKSGKESIPILEKAIAQLGDDVDKDYWKDTEGNAKVALEQLLAMAKMRPKGIWDGD